MKLRVRTLEVERAGQMEERQQLVERPRRRPPPRAQPARRRRLAVVPAALLPQRRKLGLDGYMAGAHAQARDAEEALLQRRRDDVRRRRRHRATAQLNAADDAAEADRAADGTNEAAD